MLDVDLIAPEKPRPLRRIEYERLAELGFFADERVELLYGLMVSRNPQGTRHAWVVERLTMLLASALVGRAVVRVQLPLAASDESEPEPDFAVVASGSSPGAHPSTALLVIEVADSSARKDREIKSRLYAAACVAEYWVVDLSLDLVEVSTIPDERNYRNVSRHFRGDLLSPQEFPDVTIPVDELLP